MSKDPTLGYIQDYIKSGEYFVDAREWYSIKYLSSFSQRTLMLLSACTFFVLLFGIILNIFSLFPLVEKVRYSIYTTDMFQTSAQVIKADYVSGEPLASIADIMVRDYVVQRERYNYDQLKQQFTFIKNFSTRVVYRKFYSEMNIDNINSPILRYKTDIRRNVTKIISSEYSDDNEITVRFRAISKNIAGDVIEDLLKTAVVSFDVGEIDIDAQSGSKFNFTITDYKIKASK